jgi:hypothetical protein
MNKDGGLDKAGLNDFIDLNNKQEMNKVARMLDIGVTELREAARTVGPSIKSVRAYFNGGAPFTRLSVINDNLDNEQQSDESYVEPGYVEAG